MLYVFYGTDRTLIRDKALLLVGESGVQAVSIDDSSYVPGMVVDALGAASLFGGQEWFLIDTPSLDTEFTAEVMLHLKDMSESSNGFIVLEGALLADPKKKYAKYAITIEESAIEKIERFNSFALAEALATKDKRALWVLLQQARLAKLRDEEIVGMLWWQLKALRLAKLTNTAGEAGMKDYPYKKATQALRNFKTGEVERLSQTLLELYHYGHQGIKDFDTALEEWVLSV